MSLLRLGIAAAERGLLPDLLIKGGIRKMCRTRLRQVQSDDSRVFLESLRTGPIALEPQRANEQHYELPPRFFEIVLGPRLKYSCCFFPNENASLAEAEDAAITQTLERAELADGQRILELGCGWGSLSLRLAEEFPHSEIVAVSNSASQRRFVEEKAFSRGLHNLQIVTADMNTFLPDTPTFDRIVSVEMFEHMRNLELLLHRIASWLSRDGKLFVHLFCHRSMAYPFKSTSSSDWMSRHFFTGGMMPSANLINEFDRDLKVVRTYSWNGIHYQKTANAWLGRLDENCREISLLFSKTYGTGEATLWLNRWRIFFLAVAELFGFGNGEEWFVSHYLLERSNSSGNH